MKWKVVNNKLDYPVDNEFIVYIGCSGRIGCGLTDIKGEIVVGSGGANGTYYFKDMLMYSYIKLPPIKYLKPLFNTRFFTNTYLYSYLHSKGLI
jgi:hypothetical protein